MPKTIKRILIIACVIAGVFVAAFGATLIKLTYEMSRFSVMETGATVDDIYTVKDDFSNIFVIQDNTQYIVIDCGTNQETTAQQLKNWVYPLTMYPQYS